MPIVKAKKEIDAIPAGEVLRVIATDPAPVLDFQGWVKASTSYESSSSRRKVRTSRAARRFVHLPEEEGMTAVAATEMAIDPAIRAYVDERLAEIRRASPTIG